MSHQVLANCLHICNDIQTLTQSVDETVVVAADGDAGLAGARAPGDSKGPGDGPDPLFWTRRFSLTTRILAVNLLIGVLLALAGSFTPFYVWSSALGISLGLFGVHYLVHRQVL